MSVAKQLASVAFLSVLGLLSLAAYSQTETHGEVWVGSWAASQQIPEPQNATTPDDLRDATFREIVQLSVGGSTLRVHVSNAFGFQPMRFVSVHIARSVSPGS